MNVGWRSDVSAAPALAPALTPFVFGRVSRCPREPFPGVARPSLQIGDNTPDFPRLRLAIVQVMKAVSPAAELRELHAARFADISALREMLLADRSRGNGETDPALEDRMRRAVADILLLQRDIARLGG